MNKKNNTEKLNIESSNTYDRVGGETFFNNLIDKFYEYIESDEILRPMYPEDLAPGKSHLSKFLIQFWGGPKKYSEERGHPRLKNRHIDLFLLCVLFSSLVQCNHLYHIGTYMYQLAL